MEDFKKTLNNCVLKELSVEEMKNIVGGIRIIIGNYCIFDSSRPKGSRWFFSLK